MTSLGEPREPSDPHPPSTSHSPAPLSAPVAPAGPSDTPAGADESLTAFMPLARAPRHAAHMTGHVATSAPGTRRRLTWLVMASISVLGISALLAACLYWTLLPALQALVGSQLSAAPGQATSGSASGQRTSTARAGRATLETTATARPLSDWATAIHSGANYRFQLDTPIMLACTHGFFINDFSGLGCDYTYEGAPAQTALQQVEQETLVELLSSTKITDRNICPQGGAQVRLGTGADAITGWERDDVSSTTSNGTVTLNLVVQGTPIQLSLQGFGGQLQPFFERYGAIWRHMLASFTLLPAPVTQPVHPCG